MNMFLIVEDEGTTAAVCSRCGFRSSSRDDVREHVQGHLSLKESILLHCEKCDFKGVEPEMNGEPLILSILIAVHSVLKKSFYCTTVHIIISKR